MENKKILEFKVRLDTQQLEKWEKIKLLVGKNKAKTLVHLIEIIDVDWIKNELKEEDRKCRI